MKSDADDIIVPNSGLRNRIEFEVKANTPLCWTCGACDGQCPMSVYTGKLRPQKIIRMATFGMLNELLHEPSIWYCLGCRRCSQICPNVVKPSELIAHVRRKAENKGIHSHAITNAYRVLFDHLQRARKQAVINCLNRDLDAISNAQWCKWLLSPPEESKTPVPVKVPAYLSNGNPNRDAPQALACFTCGECSSACPIACEREVFDPRVLFRKFNLGLLNELLHDPSIWLCLDCGRCTQACSQLVDGRGIIRFVKQQAIDNEIVDHAFFARMDRAHRLVLQRWIKEVDALFGFNDRVLSLPACAKYGYAASCGGYQLPFSPAETWAST